MRKPSREWREWARFSTFKAKVTACEESSSTFVFAVIGVIRGQLNVRARG